MKYIEKSTDFFYINIFWSEIANFQIFTKNHVSHVRQNEHHQWIADVFSFQMIPWMTYLARRVKKKILVGNFQKNFKNRFWTPVFFSIAPTDAERSAVFHIGYFFCEWSFIAVVQPIMSHVNG